MPCVGRVLTTSLENSSSHDMQWVYHSVRKVWLSFGAKFHGIEDSVANSCHTYIFWSVVAQLVETLRYNSEGRGFDFQ